LARARTLAAGKRGTAVLAFPAGDPAVALLARAVGAQLAQIGIHLTTRAFADPVSAANDPRQKIDLLGIAWTPPYQDPFASLNILLQPQAQLPGYPSLFSDRSWTKQLERAAQTPFSERRRAYAKLDAALARGPAPFAVLFRLPGVPQLLARRIGCVTPLPAFDGWPDLASLCVH
jgi:hypothetical protein